MSHSYRSRIPVAALVFTLAMGTLPPRAEAQLGALLKGGACAAGAFGGFKLGEKMADFEAKKLNLAPEEAKKHRLAFTIGMALALCGGGVAIAGTTHSKLSKRGKEAREKEMMAALEDAMPHTYSDPENSTLTGTAVAQPALVEGDNECRIVEDQLGADQALVKYCRKPPSGRWSVKAI
jgi:hypothetical protein